MTIIIDNRSKEEVINDVLRMLDRWYFAISADGCLQIQPRQRVIELRDFCVLMKRIHLAFKSQGFTRLILHFDDVETSRNLWVIVLRLLTAFAATVNTDCRIIRTVSPSSRDTFEVFDRNYVSDMTRTAASQSVVRLDGICAVI